MAYKLPALTSLRFFAAFMIVISHAGGLFGLHGIVDNFTLAHGVSFFFVLSGFILTYNYAGENREVNWSAYFLHRFARLWPLHIAATVLWFAMFAHPLDATMAQPLAYEALIANIFMVQSWIPIRHFFFSYNAASWSIATEAMFYLLFPLLFVSRSGWPWKGFIFSLFSLFLFGALGSYVRVPIDSESPVVSLIGLMYINPMSRLFEFALGCMTCHLFWQRRSERENHSLGKEMFAVAVFIFSCWLWKQPSISAFANEYLGTVATVYLQNAGSAIPAALLILIYAKSTGPIAKSLSSPGLLFLGEISYSLYLVHLTIYRWFEQRTAYFSESLAMLPIYLAICFSVAIALHLWIEVPLRRAIIIYKWPTLATKRSKNSFLALAACLIAAIGMQLWSPAIATSMAEQQVRLFKESGELVEVNAQFSRFAELLSIKFPKSPSEKGEMLWRATERLPENLIVGIQVYDKENNQNANLSIPLKLLSSEPVGEARIIYFDLNLGAGQELPVKYAFLLFEDWRKPFAVKSEVTDWDDHRAIVAITKKTSQ